MYLFTDYTSLKLGNSHSYGVNVEKFELVILFTETSFLAIILLLIHTLFS
jgi:hypothetical protein